MIRGSGYISFITNGTYPEVQFMISIVLGTRPEIIKMAPIIRACIKRRVDFSIIHTGQHYSYSMDRIFFEELKLPVPQYHLEVGSGNHGEQTGKIMAGVERVYMDERPDIVLVQGDTNTVMAAALASSKLHIPVGHVEAGLRSFDRKMPEEINRVVADHVSSLLFAPTEVSKRYLLNEGIDEKNIFITGNTVVDAVYQHLEIARRDTKILNVMNMSKNTYFLVTAHRAENVDVKEELNGIITGLNRIQEKYNLPVIFPIHPRTRKMMDEFGLSTGKITITEPVGYLDFLNLEENARLILTDSGGLQEEACILNVPCVTLRENTERPETIDVGANVLSGTDPDEIEKKCTIMMEVSGGWENPYGDGTAGERIVEICKGHTVLNFNNL
jgi:UDP-N-acetylglucosamine 2-epimerase (non-hydrolysing)